MGMETFRLIPRHELSSRWPRLAQLLTPAVSEGNGEVEIGDILTRALEGRMFIFADEDFAVTAEMVYYPQKTVMHIGFGGGRVPERRHVAATLKAAARRLGATTIQTWCRNPAMIRYFRRWFGLKPLYIVLETKP